jgi:hypothetical protein
LTPLRSATVLSLVFAVFSPFTLVVKETHDLVGPRDQRPVTAQSAVFDGLRVRDNRGVPLGCLPSFSNTI